MTCKHPWENRVPYDIIYTETPTHKLVTIFFTCNKCTERFYEKTEIKKGHKTI